MLLQRESLKELCYGTAQWLKPVAFARNSYAEAGVTLGASSSLPSLWSWFRRRRDRHSACRPFVVVIGVFRAKSAFVAARLSAWLQGLGCRREAPLLPGLAALTARCGQGAGLQLKLVAGPP